MPASGLPSPSRPADSGQRQAKEALRARLRASRALRADAEGPAFATRGGLLAAGHSTVALYCSAGHEPDTWPLIEALHRAGTRVMLPLLAGRRTPCWGWYAGRDALRPGWHGILEPTTPPIGVDALAEASLVFCSALAVTPRGDRLGTGGGWYDRALGLADPDAVLAALCFDDEVVDAVPTEPWDRRVDVVVTEARTLVVATDTPE